MNNTLRDESFFTKKLDGFTIYCGNKLECLDSTRYSSLLPYQAPQVKKILLKYFPDQELNYNIIDATSHIGCDSINLLALFPKCNLTSIEIDKSAFSCLEKNMSIIIKKYYNNDEMARKRIKLINNDCIVYLKRLSYEINIESITHSMIDILYFDPPWGGKAYVKEKKKCIYLNDINICNIIVECFNNLNIGKIILKAPKNFDFDNMNCIMQNKKISIVQEKIYKFEEVVVYYLLIFSPII
jgi:16S rRNA G966 N2-methylase RsmD